MSNDPTEPPHPDADFAAALRRKLRPHFAGRRFVIAGGAVVGLVRRAREIAVLGAEYPFLLGQTLGTGDAPDPALATWASVDAHGNDVVEVIHRAEAAMDAPGPDVRAAIDRWDPDGTARALGSVTLSSGRSVAGRPFFGGRSAASLAVEDKTRVDAIWDAAGVPRAPSARVDANASSDAWEAAHREHDRGTGTVWSCDTRDGVHGGAVRVRHARTPADLDEVRADLAPHADGLRVMPHLEGVPCSIHAIVLRSGTVVLRPVEMVVFRPPTGTCFRYGGLATFWDPPATHRRAMRAIARATAEHLRREHGQRGVVSIDGILTNEGFRPTEINARWAAGIETLAAAIPGLPLWPLHLTAMAGVDPDLDARELEKRIVAAADRVRGGGSWVTTAAVPKGEPGTMEFAREGEGLRPVRDGETAVGRLVWGPSGTGGFLRWIPDPATVFPGPRFAPRAVEAWRAADRWLEAGIGPLAPE